MGSSDACSLAERVALMLSRCLHGLLSERRYQIPALFLVCLITYSSVFVADYVHFDEHVEILDNHLITAPFSAASLWKILVSFEANQYTPLSLISFWVEYNLAGFNSTLSHLLGFVLHFLCVLLVYDLSRELLNDAAKAVMAAAIWAVHPLQVETVAWVLERRNILFGLFYLASLSAYCRFIKSRKSGLLLMACVFMHVSGLAKTIEFMLPLKKFRGCLLPLFLRDCFSGGRTKELPLRNRVDYTGRWQLTIPVFIWQNHFCHLICRQPTR
jgi:hypothetical protein